MKQFILFLCPLWLMATIVWGRGQDFKIVKELQPEWLVYNDGKFVSFDSADISSDVIYFKIDLKDPSAAHLRISSAKEVAVFVNNNLAASGKSFQLNVDSLGKAFASSNLLVAVYQRQMEHNNLKTQLGQLKSADTDDLFMLRAGTGFNDFAITAILLLIVFGMAIVRLNPKLAGDYFSIAKIVSAREFDEGQMYTRIGSSTNILFYVYSSMLLAYYLIITFHFVPDRYPIASDYQQNAFGFIFLDWFRIGGLLLLFVIFKIILVFGLSYLFGMPEIAGVHFFNWVRLILVILGLLTVILFMYLIWHGQSSQVYSVMFKLLGWINGLWMILIFLKLAGKSGASMFHLFSYIRATELIPFLFIVKVLYN